MKSKLTGNLTVMEPSFTDTVTQARDALLGRFHKVIEQLHARVERPDGSNMSACEVALELPGGVHIYGRHRDTEPERAIYKAFSRAAGELRRHLGRRRRQAIAAVRTA